VAALEPAVVQHKALYAHAGRSSGQGGCTQYNPSTALVRRIRNQNPPNNTFFVWLGGTVNPAVGQHTGVYLGNVTMTVAYTGN
jgi:hypothetical protein